MVNYWADVGFTSFKAYTQITRAQLGAAIRTAHARGLKVTGHLCSVTFREAADLGIDSLEHGISAATDFVSGKQPDECPARGPNDGNPEISSPEVQALIKYLVSKKVAIDSTLPVAEAGVPGRLPEMPRFWDSLSPLAQADYRLARSRGNHPRPTQNESSPVQRSTARLRASFVGGACRPLPRVAGAGAVDAGGQGLRPGQRQRALSLLPDGRPMGPISVGPIP